MDRRYFLKASYNFCAISIAGSALALDSCKKKSTTPATPKGPTVNFTLDLSKPENNNLNSAGGTLSSNGVLIVNLGGSYTAIAQTCTNDSCNVGYSQSSNCYICPCDGATYDLNGNVTSGPPPAPLKKYAVTKAGSILTIKG